MCSGRPLWCTCTCTAVHLGTVQAFFLNPYGVFSCTCTVPLFLSCGTKSFCPCFFQTAVQDSVLYRSLAIPILYIRDFQITNTSTLKQQEYLYSYKNKYYLYLYEKIIYFRCAMLREDYISE